MNITITKDDLSHALRRVQGAIASRTTLPILSYVLLRAKGESLQLVASNLDMQISHTVPVGVLRAGEVTLNQSGLSAFVNQFGPQEISLATDDKFKASLKSGAAVCSLSGTDAVEFPTFTTEATETRQSFTIEQSKLKAALRCTLIAVSTDWTRAVLNGVFFELKDDKLTMVACSGKRMSIVTHEMAGGSIAATLPTKAATEVMRLLEDGDVKVSIGENFAEFIIGETIVTAKLICEAYPNYKLPIPDHFAHRVTVMREELQSSVRLVGSATPQANKILVMKTVFNDHTLNLSCVGESSANDSLAVNYKGSEFSISIPPEQVLEILNVLTEDEVHIEFNDDLSPLAIRSDSFLGLVMPMRPT